MATLDPLFVGGVVLACFVAYNVGGSTTGPAFGPAVGAGVIGRITAGLLMSGCFFLGAWTIGRRVVETLGTDLLRDPGAFTPEVSVLVLGFIGGALFLGNLTGTPASTSMTAVGAIAGFGLAADQLAWAVVGEILLWWIVAPVAGFWLSVVVGRYYYTRIEHAIAIEDSEGPLVTLDRRGHVPRPVPGPNTTRRELVGSTAVVAIGCLMAFSSGTSNIANAIAPLVGSGAIGMESGILVGSAAVAVGALTIARRTMDTLGNDITDLPLTAALVVAVISSTIVVGLSALGVPASFVVIATTSIVGLGWGRASRTFTVAEAVAGEATTSVSVGGLRADETSPTVGDPAAAADRPDTAAIGDADAGDVPAAADLFDPETSVRVVVIQNVVPVLATAGSFLTFTVLSGGWLPI
ncbi:inorganic phosphate transporter [Halopenitus persicus]|uniref:Phosphate transporter n=1 Tax=Halopenitus persicus TaxID=1048396 RepID=A0A1H3I955_9EURY|nr:inorganic phosphate transporter [Halopenitus persicus]SDY23728.1 inorganic phosphate transporter, PiT family [Halopenitus persicus]